MSNVWPLDRDISIEVHTPACTACYLHVLLSRVECSTHGVCVCLLVRVYVRAVMGHVSIVDEFGQVVLNMYVKPDSPVTSYLPALTGLTEADCAAGVSAAECVRMCKEAIPVGAVLVGQNVLKDVEWLQLTDGEDFDSMRDLGGLWAVPNPQYRNTTSFSLGHEARALLAIHQHEQHHPAVDAWLSIKLYQLHTLLMQHPAEMERARHLLLNTPLEASFAKKNPVYDGVCMGNRRECKCGQPHFG